MHELCASLGDQVTNSALSSVFESLLNDGEAEVNKISHEINTQIIELMDGS